MWTFNEFKKNILEFEEDITWIGYLMNTCRYHAVDEEYVEVEDGKTCCCDALERMFRFIAEHYFELDWVTPEPDVECIEWLNNGYDECKKEMVDNLEYLKDIYIEYLTGMVDDMDYDTFLFTLFNDVLNFIIYYSRDVGNEPEKRIECICEDPFLSDSQIGLDDFFYDGYQFDTKSVKAIEVFNDILKENQEKRKKYEDHRIVAEEVFPSMAAEDMDLPF